MAEKFDVVATLMPLLKGVQLVKVEHREHDWTFDFGSQVGLAAECPWRILADGRIAFTDSDDGQKFGLPAPINGESRVRELIGSKAISDVFIREGTGDILIQFEKTVSLEVLNMSSGYEGWRIDIPGVSFIGLGGGDLAIWKR